MSQEEEINSPPQVPESPRRITEISFTSFASRLEKLEQSETKGDPREKGKIFWLRITRDVTKIHEMQNVFKYLRYAQVGPTIKKVKTQTFFNRWKRAISGHKWIEAASKLRDQIRINEFKDSANRITYVRSKLTKENYVKKHQFTPDFTFLSNYVTSNTVQPINQLIPAEPLPVKDEYEYEEEYEEESKEISQEELNENSQEVIPINQNKLPSSPQQSRAAKQPQFKERAVTIDQEIEKAEEEEIERVEEEKVERAEEEEISQEIINEKPSPAVPEKKKSSKLWIVLVALLVIGALVAAFVFLGKGQLGRLKSVESIDEQIPDEIPTEPTPVPEVTPEDVATENPAPENAASENLATENTVPEDTISENASNKTNEL